MTLSAMETVTPTKKQLFTGFFKTGISGFGGVLPHARRMLVDDRRWLTDRQFTELLGLGQGLPGPNIVNMAVVLGSRFHGWRGSICAVTGLMLAPLIIVLTLASIYEKFSDSAMLNHALTGVAAAAAGLIIATSAKLAVRMDRNAWSFLTLLAAFLGIVWLRLPLLAVLFVLAPISIACGWFSVQRERAGKAEE
ncbi:chromate transporter [Uliginosibacterium sp. H3]|uniref:Chromate transporter n=1 Tax=Uliginosibacterium silvisoli TaxID=3114758 RepID=A0ABU6K8Y8_9RHOO|nr:chromate transporter [Uliginosibacterium sp. H3]